MTYVTTHIAIVLKSALSLKIKWQLQRPRRRNPVLPCWWPLKRDGFLLIAPVHSVSRAGNAREQRLAEQHRAETERMLQRTRYRSRAAR